jgi:GNAT superfamily N-acetyltransferase
LASTLPTPTVPRYVKRYRMEVGLHHAPSGGMLPPGFRWATWEEKLSASHAEVLARSFHQEIDSFIFPSLASQEGCTQLMEAIYRRPGFLPQATWLVLGPAGPCGSIQGVGERTGLGSIQNLGVTPDARRFGLGQALLHQAMAGFARAGLRAVQLEVTAQNDGALRLYARLGFRRKKILYKPVPFNRMRDLNPC